MRLLAVATFTVALATSLLVAVGAAHAFNEVPGHVDIRVKAKNKTVNGVKTVVGCTVTFACKNPLGSYAASYAPAKQVRPTLWTPAAARGLGSGGRNATYHESHFTGTVLGELIDVPEQGVVYQGKIEVDYAKHGVTSGQRLTLVTGWNYGGNVHVYGAVTSYSEGNELVLP